MRKIINSAFVSLDGVTADPGSWAIFDPGAAEEAVQALHALGGMLMGRGTYEYFAEVMPKQTGPYADAINAIRKYVFSSTLENAGLEQLHPHPRRRRHRRDRAQARRWR